jgi:hypothetical protein
MPWKPLTQPDAVALLAASTDRPMDKPAGRPGRWWPWGGSALREPSTAEVYEGRLPKAQTEPVGSKPAGVNFLDIRESGSRWRSTSPGTARLVATTAPSSTAGEASTPLFLPWCKECQQPPICPAVPLGGAEYLARHHDAIVHNGRWTCEATPAAEVARLVAALPDGGGVR